MDDLQLTELFVKRRKLADELDLIDGEICSQVLERGKSFSAAGVKASYYQPSRSFDYSLAAASHPNVDEDLIREHTKVTESVSWKAVCEAAGIPEEEIPFEETPARVVVK